MVWASASARQRMCSGKVSGLGPTQSAWARCRSVGSCDDLAVAERRDPAAHEQAVGVVLRHAEEHRALERVHEGRPALALQLDAEAPGQVRDVELEAVRVRLEPVGQPAQQQRRRRAQHAEPEQLDVAGAGVVADRVDDRVRPGQHDHRRGHIHGTPPFGSGRGGGRRKGVPVVMEIGNDLPDLARRGAGRRVGRVGTVERVSGDDLDEVRGWVSAATRDRGADRSRHLDRLGHPRLPGPERGLDEEPGGREGRHARHLPERRGGAAGGLAEPGELTGLGGRAERRPPGAGRARAARAAARRRHAEHRRAAPAGRPRPGQGDRGPRDHAPLPLLGLSATPARWRSCSSGSAPARRTRAA